MATHELYPWGQATGTWNIKEIGDVDVYLHEFNPRY